MRLAALAGVFMLAATSFAAAQPYETPEALLEAFYEPYFTGDFPADESQFRSENLQALYDADAESTPEGEMGALSFDPYVDGQDYEITDLEIGEPVPEEDVVLVEVSFSNFNEPRSLTYELVEEDGWKINDVVSTNPDNEYRLSEIFDDGSE
ncbi:MAG: DUF3828 domain-containing protein [Candidatus Devosia phytovorans]|uniref:DUF3828 domain-containing protein n=1 Tax=Candidatus Devosia phytovorans TaxID=3121372 RepID=A0AAJ6B0Q3_9HYPH|nr:DUF3828 domain-containing protein [Devosia sp.]WEK05452.1 MAG: DUF3828 domain-containing protein [Devosia sp.]